MSTSLRIGRRPHGAQWCTMGYPLTSAIACDCGSRFIVLVDGKITPKKWELARWLVILLWAAHKAKKPQP